MPDISPHDDFGRWDMDPVERLRRANPVPVDEVAGLARTAGARASLEEIATMEQLAQEPETQDVITPEPTAWRRLAQRLAVAAVVLAVAGAVGVGLQNSNPSDPAPSAGERPDADTDTDPVTAGGMAMCVELYSLETLMNRDVAFAGTITAIDGDTLSFTVEEVFHGDLDEQVQLGGAEGLTMITPDNNEPVAVDDRVLVSGSDGFAWGCGFTMPYDDAVAQQWREAFAG